MPLRWLFLGLAILCVHLGGVKHQFVPSQVEGCADRAVHMLGAVDRGGTADAKQTLVGGDAAHGWLFRFSYNYYAYVGPGCGPWYPIVAAAMTERAKSAGYADGRFWIVGTGDGSDASGAPSIPPYRMVIDPRSMLETFSYDRAPLENPGIVVTPMEPDLSPARIEGISVEPRSKGFALILRTDLSQPETFLIDQGYQGEPGQGRCHMISASRTPSCRSP